MRQLISAGPIVALVVVATAAAARGEFIVTSATRTLIYSHSLSGNGVPGGIITHEDSRTTTEPGLWQESLSDEVNVGGLFSRVSPSQSSLVSSTELRADILNTITTSAFGSGNFMHPSGFSRSAFSVEFTIAAPVLALIEVSNGSNPPGRELTFGQLTNFYGPGDFHIFHRGGDAPISMTVTLQPGMYSLSTQCFAEYLNPMAGPGGSVDFFTNFRIAVVPSPASGAALLAVMGAWGRRRRRAAGWDTVKQ